MSEKKRYEIRYGKFGAYFTDSILNIELDLEHVLLLLNCSNEAHDKLKSENNELKSFNTQYLQQIFKYSNAMRKKTNEIEQLTQELNNAYEELERHWL